MMNRFTLGTAQLGMAYGIANSGGQPTAEAAKELVRAAWAAGVRSFDTAAAYGLSEVFLGRAFRDLGICGDARVITKGGLGNGAAGELSQSVQDSMQRLQVNRLAGWLLHDERQLAHWSPTVASEARALEQDGTVPRFGVSVYDPEAALRAVEVKGLRAVQFPASPMDRRFLRGDVQERLAVADVLVFVRSVFLQGLCLMAPQQVPSHIFRGREAVGALAKYCATLGYAPDFFCLHYVLHRTAGSGACLVIGLERSAQLERNLELLNSPPPAVEHFDGWDAAWPDDLEDLIIPSRWRPKT